MMLYLTNVMQQNKWNDVDSVYQGNKGHYQTPSEKDTTLIIDVNYLFVRLLQGLIQLLFGKGDTFANKR